MIPIMVPLQWTPYFLCPGSLVRGIDSWGDFSNLLFLFSSHSILILATVLLPLLSPSLFNALIFMESLSFICWWLNLVQLTSIKSSVICMHARTHHGLTLLCRVREDRGLDNVSDMMSCVSFVWIETKGLYHLRWGWDEILSCPCRGSARRPSVWGIPDWSNWIPAPGLPCSITPLPRQHIHTQTQTHTQTRTHTHTQTHTHTDTHSQMQLY